MIKQSIHKIEIFPTIELNYNKTEKQILTNFIKIIFENQIIICSYHLLATIFIYLLKKKRKKIDKISIIKDIFQIIEQTSIFFLFLFHNI